MPVIGNYDPKRLWQADRDHCIHPWTEFPEWTRSGSTIVVRGEGCRVWDAEGRQYLDAMGGLWFANVGFGRQELIDAAARQLAMLPQYSFFTNLGNPPAADLAARLAGLAPGDLDHVFFSTGGSTANDSAMRIAHYYFHALGKPAKRLAVARRNAYHGSTFLTAALSGKADERVGFQLPQDWVHHVSEANCYRMPDGIESEAAYCDFLTWELEREIAALGPDNVACFFAEPIQGAGGVLVPPAGYHRRMKEVCERHDVLYVADEVVTGFGRLGCFFASEERFGIVPDMIVAAKGITSGYLPLGATIVSDRIFEGVSRTGPEGGLFSHGFTSSGHAAACAVALANIDLMEREDLCGHVRAVGPYFEERLKVLGKQPIVGDVRGSHFMLCVEAVQDRASREPFPASADVGNRIAAHAQARGVLVRPIGNYCVLSPALILTRAEIDRIVEVVEESIEAATADLRREGIPFST